MSFETKFEQFEDSLSNLSSIVSECKDIGENTNECVFKNAYLLSECNEIDNLIDELSDKIVNIKNLLMGDVIAQDDDNYEILVNAKIEENKKHKRFMEMFGPYMFLHINNEINT